MVSPILMALQSPWTHDTLQRVLESVGSCLWSPPSIGLVISEDRPGIQVGLARRQLPCRWEELCHPKLESYLQLWQAACPWMHSHEAIQF